MTREEFIEYMNKVTWTDACRIIYDEIHAAKETQDV